MPTSFLASDPILDQDRENPKFPQKESGIHPIGSASAKPLVKTKNCEASHLQYPVTGRIRVVMDDGSEEEFGPGDASHLPPGHDAWVGGFGHGVGAFRPLNFWNGRMNRDTGWAPIWKNYC